MNVVPEYACTPEYLRVQCTFMRKLGKTETFSTTGIPVIQRLSCTKVFIKSRVMSSERFVSGSDKTPKSAAPNVVPFFVCPGVRDVPLTIALFPIGGDLSEPRSCPARDICVWYAAHDLGGTVEFNDVPEGRQLYPQFVAQPFGCLNFCEQSKLRRIRPRVTQHTEPEFREAHSQ